MADLLSPHIHRLLELGCSPVTSEEPRSREKGCFQRGPPGSTWKILRIQRWVQGDAEVTCGPHQHTTSAPSSAQACRCEDTRGRGARDSGEHSPAGRAGRRLVLLPRARLVASALCPQPAGWVLGRPGKLWVTPAPPGVTSAFHPMATGESQRPFQGSGRSHLRKPSSERSGVRPLRVAPSGTRTVRLPEPGQGCLRPSHVQVVPDSHTNGEWLA